jgi:ketosteroid isomerase-like protein
MPCKLNVVPAAASSAPSLIAIPVAFRIGLRPKLPTCGMGHAFGLVFAAFGSRQLKKTIFSSPQDAEAAFYDALQRADLDAMMEIWSAEEEVSCIHPNGARLTGYEQVRENWAQIFKSGQRLQVTLSDQVIVTGMMYSLHSVHENILVLGGQGEGARSVVVTTNVYLRSAAGWRLVLHHASHAPAPVVRREVPVESPKVLH